MKSRVEFTVMYIYLFIYLFIYLSVRLVCAGNDVTRPRAGGLMVSGAEKLRSSGLRAGVRILQGVFFSSFFFSFFFLFRILSLSLSLSFFSVFLFGLR